MSDSTMKVFNVNDREWRFGTTEDGTPYAVAADVAKSFDYRDASNALRVLDEDEKGTQIVSTPGGPQEMKVIYEDGLWELIFRSTKPGAKAIKKRVKAILREIRQTGQYAPDKPLDEIEVAERYLTALKQKRALEIANSQLSEELSIAAPKADKWEAYMNSDGLIGMTELAGVLGMSAVAMTKRLVERQVFRTLVRDGKNARVPRTKYLDNGMFQMKAEVRNGRPITVNYASPSGADHVMDLLQHPLARQ